MKHFMDLGFGDIWHLEACLSAARKSARAILDLPAPVTENQVRKHKDVELEFDIQLTHIRQYLNETWRAAPTDEDNGPPEAIDEGEEGPIKHKNNRAQLTARGIRMPLVIVGPVEKSSFKITPGDAAVLETMAEKLSQESRKFLEDIEEENEFLNSVTEALFLFLQNRAK